MQCIHFMRNHGIITAEEAVKIILEITEDKDAAIEHDFSWQDYCVYKLCEHGKSQDPIVYSYLLEKFERSVLTREIVINEQIREGADEAAAEVEEEEAEEEQPLQRKRKLGIKDRFATKDAHARFENMGNKKVDGERPFHADVLKMEEFQNFAKDLKIGELVGVSGKTSQVLVREWYANFDDSDDTIFMRGVYVPCDYRAINQVLGRESVSESAAETLRDVFKKVDSGTDPRPRKWIEEIFGEDNDSLYVQKKTKPFEQILFKNIPQRLVPLVNWVSSRIWPSGHLTNLSVKILWIIDQVVNKRPGFDLGVIIELSMIRISRATRNNLGHSFLIRDLCAKAGVEILKSELDVLPGPNINLTREFSEVHGLPVLKPTRAVKGKEIAKQEVSKKRKREQVFEIVQRKKVASASTTVLPDIEVVESEEEDLSQLSLEEQVQHLQKQLKAEKLRSRKMEHIIKTHDEELRQMKRYMAQMNAWMHNVANIPSLPSDADLDKSARDSEADDDEELADSE